MKRAVQKNRDARWTVKDSQAKPAPVGAKRVDIAIPMYGYKNMPEPTAAARSEIRARIEHVFAR